MKCARCDKYLPKEDQPLEDGICESCVNDMIMSSPKSYDWNYWDFEKADYKKES